MKPLIDTVWRENLRLKASGLVTFTWGNVSAIDREAGLVAIKPSGVDYETLTPADIVLTDMKGAIVASALKPSSDVPTHLVLYRAFPGIGAVVHTHATYATAFAQACRPVPCLGTTQADYFFGTVPVTDPMNRRDIRSEYEAHTGDLMVKKIRRLNMNPLDCPSILVANHAPFSWGPTATKAVENAIVLEEVCKMAWLTYALNGKTKPVASCLLEKHYRRKHGSGAYYGQTARGAGNPK
ncbi:MAG: L-ribulose-5-phosphate 4-epimerase AraD [Verrucomicrobia bacterium]|nr:L-ribulose-5-phosphate 4-epimerase AraD [Verrucomicrobiota bacterium]MBU4291251.1 L-ribulose-5-phosphate 4-epimerase AraD [Verrucomicrobiota bacterium]MBU4429889.1 L-ribulose-5-phosphate 4-epimerase AraD [Verrucomicrobiota bacterium]MCG2678702.1 L-ribulose-5-phosphate 4-epimerase AraD [Kiritimatiellia bacterium]